MVKSEAVTVSSAFDIVTVKFVNVFCFTEEIFAVVSTTSSLTTTLGLGGLLFQKKSQTKYIENKDICKYKKSEMAVLLENHLLQ